MASDRDALDVPPPGGYGPLDKTYRDTNIVVLILFGLCCGLLAFVITLVAYLTAKDSKAKSNAQVVLIVSGIMSLLNIAATVMNFMSGAATGATGAR